MKSFKDIKKGTFFQDVNYYPYDTKHCYLKTGTYQFLDLESGQYVDVRNKYTDEQISGDYDWCFRTVDVDIKIR